MGVAEKVIKFAENQQIIDEKLNGDFSSMYDNGYNAGFTEGKNEGYNKGYSAGYDGGFINGKESVLNPFEYATSARQMFNVAVFPEGFEFEAMLPITTNNSGMFWAAKGIKKITLSGNTSGADVNFENAFREMSSCETIDLSGFNCKLSRTQMMFYNSPKLKYIYGTLDVSNTNSVTSMFRYDSALLEVRFKADSIYLSMEFAQSSKLSAESVQSIIDGLATVETQQTLTLHSTIKTNLTDEQKTAILSKNWLVQ